MTFSRHNHSQESTMVRVHNKKGVVVGHLPLRVSWWLSALLSKGCIRIEGKVKKVENKKITEIIVKVKLFHIFWISDGAVSRCIYE